MRPKIYWLMRRGMILQQLRGMTHPSFMIRHIFSHSTIIMAKILMATATIHHRMVVARETAAMAMAMAMLTQTTMMIHISTPSHQLPKVQRELYLY